MSLTINLERVYADASGNPSDGLRVFVDRLWPRGESKEKFKYDIWAKEIAPSTELRKWFHDDPENRWTSFEEKYTEEIAANPAVAKLIDDLKRHKVVTLLYSAHDPDHNNAFILKKYIEQRLNGAQ